MIAGQSIGEFCNDLAARTPSPGGGATAALAGALGAAQLAMVAEYAAWTEKRDPRPLLREAIGSFLKLADEDAEAYAAYRAGPKDNDAAKARIAAVPQAVLEVAASTLEAVEVVKDASKSWFSADIAIAAACLDACSSGARLLAEMNA